MTAGSVHRAIASVWGTSVPLRASMIRHSRTIPSSRESGADVGGMRMAQCRSPRRSS